jgi:hypothetical protein
MVAMRHLSLPSLPFLQSQGKADLRLLSAQLSLFPGPSFASHMASGAHVFPTRVTVPSQVMGTIMHCCDCPAQEQSAVTCRVQPGLCGAGVGEHWLPLTPPSHVTSLLGLQLQMLHKRPQQRICKQWRMWSSEAHSYSPVLLLQLTSWGLPYFPFVCRT